ncbi:MAG: hypothetical protein R3F46_15105 [bacterium]
MRAATYTPRENADSSALLAVHCLSILLQFLYFLSFLHFSRRMLSIHRRGAA